MINGRGIGNIDTQGNVHPDQFWQTLSLGNVKERPFIEIWTDPTHETLAALRNRAGRIQGRSGAAGWFGLRLFFDLPQCAEIWFGGFWSR